MATIEEEAEDDDDMNDMKCAKIMQSRTDSGIGCRQRVRTNINRPTIFSMESYLSSGVLCDERREELMEVTFSIRDGERDDDDEVGEKISELRMSWDM